jgi:predicted ATPase
MAVRGFAAAEVEEVYTRALDLCSRHTAPQQAFRVRWLLGLFRYFRAELHAAFDIAEQLLVLARELADPFVTIEAHRACGVTLVDLGRFEEALTYLETVTRLYESGRQYRHVSLAGQDPKAMAECYAARAHWALGEPDRALARVERAVSFARELSHGETLVIATYFAAHIHQLRGEAAPTQERAETVIALADEYGLELWSAFGHIYRGWAVAEQGDPAKGIEELQRGLAAYEATGASLWKGYSLGLLAQALARAGRIEDARSTLAQALTLVQQTGEQACMMELRRIKGALSKVRPGGPRQ